MKYSQEKKHKTAQRDNEETTQAYEKHVVCLWYFNAWGKLFGKCDESNKE